MTEESLKIWVENDFDEEERRIKIKPSKIQKDSHHLLYSKIENQLHKKEHKYQYRLSSADSLELSVEGEPRQAKSSTDYWCVKLPAMADFEFVPKGNTPIPILEMKRDDSGKTIIYLPPDPSTWKLIVKYPKHFLKQNKTNNLNTQSLLNQGGQRPPDNVSIGDNGP